MGRLSKKKRVTNKKGRESKKESNKESDMATSSWLTSKEDCIEVYGIKHSEEKKIFVE